MDPLRILSLLFLFYNSTMAQEFPFSSLPPPAETYTAGNTISRMIEGLGFRYYWATEALRDQDLTYRPSDEAQSALGTIQHIYGLSRSILNAVKNIASVRPAPKPPETLENLRGATLNYLKQAADLFQNTNKAQLEQLNIIFDRDGKQSKFPIWNLINGPIADAIYHTGQLVSFRRTTGNPIPKGVNVFLGIKN